MEHTETQSARYSKESTRYIRTPSAFARTHFLYAQELGQLQRLYGTHQRKRNALDSYLFVTVCGGTGVLQYQGSEYQLTQGDCFWIDCRHQHAYQSSTTAPWHIKWVHFNGAHAAAYYELFRAHSPCAFQSVYFSQLEQCIAAMLHACAEGTQPLEALLSCQLTNLATLAITPAQQKAFPNASPKMQEIRQYLQAHYTEPLTLERLADQFYLSKFYLARQFKATYDRTVVEYLIELRITEAKRLLRYSEHSIAEISTQCGYTSQSYFSRQFLQAEGISANAYRRGWK